MKLKINYSVCGAGKNIVMLHGWGMHDASRVPFISHPDYFLKTVLDFIHAK